VMHNLMQGSGKTGWETDRSSAVAHREGPAGPRSPQVSNVVPTHYAAGMAILPNSTGTTATGLETSLQSRRENRRRP
jgi:hypothetical protein